MEECPRVGKRYRAIAYAACAASTLLRIHSRIARCRCICSLTRCTDWCWCDRGAPGDVRCCCRRRRAAAAAQRRTTAGACAAATNGWRGWSAAATAAAAAAAGPARDAAAVVRRGHDVGMCAVHVHEPDGRGEVRRVREPGAARPGRRRAHIRAVDVRRVHCGQPGVTRCV
jgi:hypothetical protein